MVAVGTTVRNAVQRFAEPTPWQLANTTTGIGPTPSLLDEPADPAQRAARAARLARRDLHAEAIDFTNADQAIGSCGDGFDLPLLKGDLIQTRVATGVASRQARRR